MTGPDSHVPPSKTERHPDADARFLTVAQVAQQLSCCTKTVRRMIDARDLPIHRMGKRLIRIAASDVERFIRSSRA
jgi:excisionase family DNA binding protein